MKEVEERGGGAGSFSGDHSEARMGQYHEFEEKLEHTLDKNVFQDQLFSDKIFSKSLWESELFENLYQRPLVGVNE